MTILIAYSYNVLDFLFSKQMGLESIPSVERSRRPQAHRRPRKMENQSGA